jgi:hypothetical protein
MNITKHIYLIIVSSLIVIFPACVPVGELQEESRTIEMGEAESVDVIIEMAAGELRIQGGSKALLEGDFRYNVDKWKPDISYHVLGRQGILKVRQGKVSGIPAGEGKNKWDIFLNEGVPLSMRVNFGAGEGRLDLRGLILKSVAIDMGVGDLSVNLRGERIQDLDVKIDGGVGSATVYLPKDQGVRVSVDKGIGSVDASGFKKRGSIYTNDAYGKAEITLDVQIDAGIGTIDLRLR